MYRKPKTFIRKLRTNSQLQLTSEFNEVFSSEMGEAEATHSRDPRRKNLGKISWNGVETNFAVKFLLVTFPVTSEAEFWEIA